MLKMNFRNILRQRNRQILASFVVVICWYFWWILSRILIIFPFDISIGVNELYIYYSLWILVLAAIAIWLWKNKVNNFSFLKTKKPIIFVLYSIPLILSILLVFQGNIYGINSIAWVLGIWLTTFIAQDIVTFGILQTFLEDKVGSRSAAILTLIIFLSGHLIGETLSVGTLAIYFVGFNIFVFLRYKTKNIYALDIIHISFSLLTVLIL